MGLPILETPMHSCVLPSTNERVEFRPFLVGEQKVLMIAQESDDQNTQVSEMIRLINACTEDIDAKKLPTIDLEYLFLQIRIKSVGETSDIVMKCSKCEADNELTVDLESAEVIKEKEVSNLIKLTNKISIELKYPTYETMKGLDLSKEDTNTDEAFKLMQRCIVTIIDGDVVHTQDDFTEKELVQFVDSMSLDMFEGVQDYLSSAPALTINTGFKCSSCGSQEESKLEGIGNFFA